MTLPPPRHPGFTRLHSPVVRRGFTLIELLLVMGIAAVLLGVLFTTMNPSRELRAARDRKRQNDLASILNAVQQYEIDTNRLPAGIPLGTPVAICATGAESCTNGIRLEELTQGGTYLTALPRDPHAPASGTGTQYLIMRDANKRLTLLAPLMENESMLAVTR
jgi:prepilin-type N-terminal cleavage/methylation domain-containing protein